MTRAQLETVRGWGTHTYVLSKHGPVTPENHKGRGEVLVVSDGVVLALGPDGMVRWWCDGRRHVVCDAS